MHDLTTVNLELLQVSHQDQSGLSAECPYSLPFVNVGIPTAFCCTLQAATRWRVQATGLQLYNGISWQSLEAQANYQH